MFAARSIRASCVRGVTRSPRPSQLVILCIPISVRGGGNDSPPLFVSIIIFLFFCPPRPTALSKVPSSTRGEQRTKMKMEESRDFLTPLPLTPSDIPFQFSARFLRMKGTCPSSFALSPAPGGPKVTEIRRDLGGAAIRRNFEMFASHSFTTCMFCLGRPTPSAAAG